LTSISLLPANGWVDLHRRNCMRTTQTILETVLERQADGKGLQRGLVLAVNPGGFVTVVMDQKEITCDVLQAAAQPLTPAHGDSVLVWLPVGDDRGIILGRIGPSPALVSHEKDSPDELVLEARKNLTL